MFVFCSLSISQSFRPRFFTKVISLEHGLIHVKQAFSLERQKQLAETVLRMHQGFFNEKGELNCKPYRGRIFKDIPSLPEPLRLIGPHVLNLADIKHVEHTHMILLYYKTLLEVPKEGYIPWHQDNGENDGQSDYPVVALSLGDSCDFLVCHKKPMISKKHGLADPVNLAHRIRFSSGDALIFGGKCRMIWHSIYDIIPHTCPEELPLTNTRLNFTLRYTPELFGQEGRFAKIDPTIKGDNPFYKPSRMK